MWIGLKWGIESRLSKWIENEGSLKRMWEIRSRRNEEIGDEDMGEI